MNQPRVVYVSVGNPSTSRAGMDLVLRAHLAEIVASDDIALEGIFVPPEQHARQTSEHAPWLPKVQFAPADAESGRSKVASQLAKALYLISGGFLPLVEFRSRAARRAIRTMLRSRPDCVVVDHFYALANVSILDLLRAVALGRCKLVYIAHDATPVLFRDLGKLKASVLGRLIYAIQAQQAALVEQLLFRLATRVIFISAHDRERYGQRLAPKSLALCPLVAGDTPLMADHRPKLPQFLFVGAPNFAPNAFALEWIRGSLAPRLREIAPDVSIVLVGKGVDRLDWGTIPNLTRLGFVSEADLIRLFEESAGTICPIVHGSGLKIKVLEALSHGSPVFATEQSLHGFAFMELAPMVFIDDVERTVQALAAFTRDPDAQRQMRAAVAERWNAYLEVRRSALVRSIADVAIGAHLRQPDEPR